jgi:CRP/FNR family transcriptional regulator, anaerobic regulatory protein
MESLLQYINSIYPLSTEIIQALSQKLRKKIAKRKEFLLREGQICKSIFFIEKGLLRCFYIKGAKEVSTWFMKEGDMVISVESFYKQQPSYESIQALDDCILYSMEYEDLQEMYHMYPTFNFNARKVTEDYYALSEQRLYSLRMQRASDRYKFLLERHADLIKRVPSKYLSSYLGITEETLSRIKSKI